MVTSAIEEEGQKIAKELGVTYTGPQYHKDEFRFHLFTDPVTGGTFAATNRLGAWARFFDLRDKFGAPEPIGLPSEWNVFIIRYRGNVAKELRERGLLPSVEVSEYCIAYGNYNPRSHTCIKGIEGLNPICLRCKRLWEFDQLQKESAPTIIEQFPLPGPEEMDLGGLEVPVPPPRGSEKPKKEIPENAAIRTAKEFDNTVEHLGYVSMDFSPEDLSGLQNLPTDRELVQACQDRLRNTQVVPDEQLARHQLAHLQLARVIADRVFPYNKVSGVYAAAIPPASDRVRTAGMYGTSTQAIYLSPEILNRGRDTVDTLIHELGHHQQWKTSGEAEDLAPAHAAAMREKADLVIQDAASGRYDQLLKDVIW